jgi:hypothetical protein
MKTYAELVALGCLCGTDRIAECPVHAKPGDNRGIAAFFKAGMPCAFPMAANCAVCDADGLMYPNVGIDDPNGDGQYRPTLICPTCSKPAAERALVREAQDFGHKLNDARVFGALGLLGTGPSGDDTPTEVAA